MLENGRDLINVLKSAIFLDNPLVSLRGSVTRGKIKKQYFLFHVLFHLEGKVKNFSTL